MHGSLVHPLDPQPPPPPPGPPDAAPTPPGQPFVSSSMQLQLLLSPSSSSSAFTPSFVGGQGAGLSGGLFSLCGLTPPISPAAANGAGLAHAPPHALFSTPTALQSHVPAQSMLHMFLSAPSSAVPSRTQSPADGSTAMSDLGLSRDGAMIDSLSSSRDSHAGARFLFSFNSAGGLTPMMMLSHSAAHSRPHSPNANHAFASPPQPAHAQLGAMHSQPLFALNSDGSTAVVGSPHLHGLFASLLKEGSSPPSLSSGVVQSSAPASLHPSPPHTLRAHGGGSRDSSGDSWSHNRMDLTDNSKAVFELFDPVPLDSQWHARLAHTTGATSFADRGSSNSTFGSSSAPLCGTGGSSRTSSLPHSQVQSPVSRTRAYLSLQTTQSHARTPPSLSSMLAQSSLSQSQSPPQPLSHHEPPLHSAQLRSHASPAHAENPVAAASVGSHHASLAAPLRSGGPALSPKHSAADLSESYAMAPSVSSGSSVLSSPSAAVGSSSKPPTAFVCEVCQKQFTQKGGLQNHERIHKGERPFKCEWEGCDKAFAQKCNLTRHQRCHTGEKPYKCSLCPKAYNRRWGLLVHSRLHGRDVPVMHKQRVFPKGAAASAATAAREPAATRAIEARSLRPRSKALLADSDSDYDESRDAAAARCSTRPSLSSSAPLLPLASRVSRGAQTNLESASARLAGLALHSNSSTQRQAPHRAAFASCSLNSAAAAPALVSSSPPLLPHPLVSALSGGAPPSAGLLEFASSHPPSLLGRHPATRPLRTSGTEQERARARANTAHR